jgi:16S rRNA (guanine966-N2)-methyltransferase
MRIIAGEWRGRKLVAPAGMATRPTADRAREGLFSMLQSRLGNFVDLRVADLFAGSGALGLEALSRGAAHCLFVDSDRAAAEAIKANVATLGAGSRAEIRQQSVKHAMPPSEPCDLILLDPPYGAGFADKALALLAADPWLKPHALLSIETESEELDLPDGLTREAHRRFGKAHIHLLRRG